MGQERPDAPVAPGPSEPGRPPVGRRSTRFEVARTAGQVGSLGFSLVLAIVIGVVIGRWLDRVTGWSPLFFIVFFIAGVAAGILNVYRVVSRLGK
jgi:ATP synthase protein I